MNLSLLIFNRLEMDYIITFPNSIQHIDMKNTYITRQQRGNQHKILKIINGHAFYPSTNWPLHIQLALTDTPISDTSTFKLLLFFYGNGCSPQLTFEIIYASHPTNEKINKRFYQLKWITNNLQNKMHTWYPVAYLR